MALADSQFDESEIAILYNIGKERGVPKSEIDHIILNPAVIKFTIPDSINEKIEYLYDYAKMILADGKIEEQEIKTFEKFCLKFEFEDQNISSIVNFLIEAAKNDVSIDEIIKFVTSNN